MIVGIKNLHIAGYTCYLLCYRANLDHKVSEVLSLKQSDEGVGSVFKPSHNILAILDLPCGEPFQHLLLKIAEVSCNGDSLCFDCKAIGNRHLVGLKARTMCRFSELLMLGFTLSCLLDPKNC